jgi:hypothetical protein
VVAPIEIPEGDTVEGGVDGGVVSGVLGAPLARELIQK